MENPDISISIAEESIFLYVVKTVTSCPVFDHHFAHEYDRNPPIPFCGGKYAATISIFMS
jgi:hypothetical protein